MHAPLNRNEVQPPVVLDDVEELLGLSEGEDWAPLETEGEDENVMEEWESDEEVLASEGSGEEEDAHVIGSDDEGDLIYASFLDSFRDRHADETEGDFISFTDPTDMHPGDRFQDKSTCEYEHIAGSSCEVKRGYNGHQIRAEEMFACKTVQCLAHKANHWQPEPDDPEFEQDSRYFLSGLADYMPSRDWNRPHFVPLRNGLETADADVHDYLVMLLPSKRVRSTEVNS